MFNLELSFTSKEAKLNRLKRPASDRKVASLIPVFGIWLLVTWERYFFLISQQVLCVR